MASSALMTVDKAIDLLRGFRSDLPGYSDVEIATACSELLTWGTEHGAALASRFRDVDGFSALLSILRSGRVSEAVMSLVNLLLGVWPAPADRLLVSTGEALADMIAIRTSPSRVAVIVKQLAHLPAHSAVSFLGAGAAKPLLSLLRRCIADQAVVVEACRVLQCVLATAASGDGCDARRDDWLVVVDVLRTHAASQAIVGAVASILHVLCHSSGNGSVVAAAGGVGVLFDAAQRHIGDADCVAQLFGAVARVAKDSAAVAAGVLTAGGGKAAALIVDGLRRHARDAVAAHRACAAMLTLVWRAEDAAALVAAGAPAALREAIRVGADKDGLQTVLSIALIALGRCCSALARSPDLLQKFDICAADIVAALRVPTADGEFAAIVLGALVSLSHSSACLAAYRSANMPKLVVTALRSHHSYARAAVAALRLMSALRASDERMRSFIDEGAGDLVADILARLLDLLNGEAYAGTPAELRQAGIGEALTVLASFAVQEKGRACLGTRARVELLVRACRQPCAAADPMLASFCATLLAAAVVVAPKLAKVAMALGAVQALVFALKPHVSISAVATTVCASITRMVHATGPAFVQALPDATAAGASIMVLVQALELHISGYDTAFEVARVMQLLTAENRANAAACISGGGAAVFARSLARYRTDARMAKMLLTTVARAACISGREFPLSVPSDFGAVLAETMANYEREDVMVAAGMALLNQQLTAPTDAPFCFAFCRSGGAKVLMGMTNRVTSAGPDSLHAQANEAVSALLDLRNIGRYFVQGGFGAGNIMQLRKSASEKRSGKMESQLCCLFADVCLHDDEAADLLVRMGAAEAIVGVMGPSGQLGDAELAQSALLSLRNLAACAPARRRMVAAGVAAAAVGAMQKYLAAKRCSELANLCAAGCGLLRNLSATAECRAELMAAGALSAALKILRSPSCAGAAVAWPICALLFGLACEPVLCEPMLRADAAADAIRAMRTYPTDRRIGWAVSGLLLRCAQACAASNVEGEHSAARFLSLLQEGVGAALSMHGAADARAACAAVAAAQSLAAASAVRGKPLPKALISAVRSTLAAHEPLAAKGGAKADAGSKCTGSADVVARCQELLRSVSAGGGAAATALGGAGGS